MFAGMIKTGNLEWNQWNETQEHSGFRLLAVEDVQAPAPSHHIHSSYCSELVSDYMVQRSNNICLMAN